MRGIHASKVEEFVEAIQGIASNPAHGGKVRITKKCGKDNE